MSQAAMQTTLSEMRDDVVNTRLDVVRLDGRVKSIETIIAEQKSNRLWLIALTIGVAADVGSNLLPYLFPNP